MFKRCIALLTAALTVISVCAGIAVYADDAQQGSVYPDSPVIHVNETLSLTALKSNGASLYNAVWFSSAPELLSVTSYGTITAHAASEEPVTISFRTTDNSFFGSTQVTCLPAVGTYAAVETPTMVNQGDIFYASVRIYQVPKIRSTHHAVYFDNTLVEPVDADGNPLTYNSSGTGINNAFARCATVTPHPNRTGDLLKTRDRAAVYSRGLIEYMGYNSTSISISDYFSKQEFTLLTYRFRALKTGETSIRFACGTPVTLNTVPEGIKFYPDNGYSLALDTYNNKLRIVDQPTAASVELDTHEASIYANESLRLNATVYTTAEHSTALGWLSLTPDIVAVDASGTVTGLASGTGVIRAVSAYDSKLYDECVVTVKGITPPVAQEQEQSLRSNQVIPIQLLATDAEDDIIGYELCSPPHQGTATLLDAAAGTVEYSPNPWAGGEDSFTFRAIDAGGRSSELAAVHLRITTYAEPESLTLNVTTLTLSVGDSFTPSASFQPDYTTERQLTWHTANPDIATVEDGVITAILPGECTVTAETINGLTAELTVQVIAEPESIDFALENNRLIMEYDTQYTLTPVFLPDYTTERQLTWQTTNPDIATVEDGVITAHFPGSCTITAQTVNHITASAAVEVTALPTAIYFEPDSGSAVQGEQLTIQPVFQPDFTTETNIVWESSDEEIAAVADGVITPVNPGSCTITATAKNGLSASFAFTTIRFNNKPTAASFALPVRQDTSAQFFLIGYDADDDPLVYSLLCPPSHGTASLDEASGKLTYLPAPGFTGQDSLQYIVTDSMGASSAPAEVTLSVEKRLVLVSAITVKEPYLALVVNESTLPELTVYPPDAVDCELSYESSNPAVVQVDRQTGRLSALSTGTAVITAFSRSVSASYEVTVYHTAEDIAVKAITPMPDVISLLPGERQQTALRLMPPNAALQTPVFHSSNTTVARVDASGVVTAVQPGTAIIYAQAGEHTAQIPVTVRKTGGTKPSASGGSIRVDAVVQTPAQQITADFAAAYRQTVGRGMDATTQTKTLALFNRLLNTFQTHLCFYPTQSGFAGWTYLYDFSYLLPYEQELQAICPTAAAQVLSNFNVTLSVKGQRHAVLFPFSQQQGVVFAPSGAYASVQYGSMIIATQEWKQ